MKKKNLSPATLSSDVYKDTDNILDEINEAQRGKFGDIQVPGTIKGVKNGFVTEQCMRLRDKAIGAIAKNEIVDTFVENPQNLKRKNELYTGLEYLNGMI